MRYRKDEAELPGSRLSQNDSERKELSPVFQRVLCISIFVLLTCALGITVVIKPYSSRVSVQSVGVSTGYRNTAVINATIVEEVRKAIQNQLSPASSGLRSAATFKDIQPASSILVRQESEKAVDKCAAEWTPDSIVGRCFGLSKEPTDFPQISNPIVTSADDCKRFCCELGDNCVTWQYWEGLQRCRVGKAIRLGKEGGATPNWCDSSPPVQWFGAKVLSRNSSSSSSISSSAMSVEWSPRVTTQCFGLGPERMKHQPTVAATTTTGTTTGTATVPYSVQECQEQCRLSASCNIWQAHPQRGCYYNYVRNVFCEPYTGRFFGGRKCRKPYCKVAAV